ncbi:hypothetical protein NDU88_001166 [Pleurodeles waltl]|uniref:Uncharacterized protein n=1 Tax=Pleurodeles waltl TaxID=8319 RepID=A0AAV7THW7_PLEWA|nr:hypothetical protein NDU88_001166 [Pleurodeles waltl]
MHLGRRFPCGECSQSYSGTLNIGEYTGGILDTCHRMGGPKGRRKRREPWYYRQQLYREEDRSGCMLAWLLKRERPLPIILSLHGPSGEWYLGQALVNLLLWDHLKHMYTLPKSEDGCQMRQYLDRLQISWLVEAQTEELEWDVALEKLQEALGAMTHGKTPGPMVYQLSFTMHILQQFSPNYWEHSARPAERACCQHT